MQDYPSGITNDQLSKDLPKSEIKSPFVTPNPLNLNVDPVLRFLREIKCDSAIFPSPLSLPITISTTATVADALKIMIDNQLLAVPVIDENTSEAISILSMFHLVSYIVDQSSEEDLLEIKFRSSQTWQLLYDRMISTKDTIALQRLDKLLQKKMFEFEDLDPVYTVYGTFPLQAVADLMVGTKAHRILVLDEKGRFANVISQTRLLEILGSIMAGFPELSRPITQIGLWEKAIKNVESIHEYDMAFNAFKKMKEKKSKWLGCVE